MIGSNWIRHGVGEGVMTGDGSGVAEADGSGAGVGRGSGCAASDGGGAAAGTVAEAVGAAVIDSKVGAGEEVAEVTSEGNGSGTGRLVTSTNALPRSTAGATMSTRMLIAIKRHSLI